MKLGEALTLRSDLYKKLAVLLSRATECAQVQEGTETVEQPNEVMREYHSVSCEALHLVQRINRTNSLTTLPSGKMLVDALVERDQLKSLAAAYNSVLSAGSERSYRFSRTELKTVSNVDIKKMRAEADKYSAAHRKLDLEIQEANWLTDLGD